MPFDLSRYGVTVEGYGGSFSRAPADISRNFNAYGQMQKDKQQNEDVNGQLERNAGGEGVHNWTAGDSLLSFGQAGGGGKGFQKWSKAIGAMSGAGGAAAAGGGMGAMASM